MECLMDIRNQQDPSLSLRYSCREAICGSCAMVINGEIALACRTPATSIKTQKIIIEPLPHFDIQKDLVVDMDPFWKAYERIQPYLQPEGNPPEKGHRVQEKQMDKINQFTNCILCASCFSACPVTSRDDDYLGPASLAKLFRFIKDPRDSRPFDSWSDVNSESGIWGCDTVFKCNEVCPKDVRPADGIQALRRRMILEIIKNIVRKTR